MTLEEQPSFAALLSRSRLAAGLTQLELAERSGLSVRGISDLERGVKTRPRAYTVRHLADALMLGAEQRGVFEMSALDPARLLAGAQPASPAPEAPHGGRERAGPEAVRAVSRALRLRSFVFLVLGFSVVLLAVGALALARERTGAGQAKLSARLVGVWSISAPTPAQLVSPAAVTIGPGGTVYVADSGANRIDAFTRSGRALFSWGTAGRRPGQLRHPQGLALDGQGDIYVADTGNDRIEKFSVQGRFLMSFGRRGSGPGEFRSPEGVTVSPSTSWIYVADTGNHRIQSYTPDGVPVGRWDSGNTQRGLMLWPTSLVVADDGSVIAADGRGQQVQVLDPDGSFVRNVVILPPPEFLHPSAVARDAGSYFYALDTDLETVRKFDPYGHVLATWHVGSRSAHGLAVDGQGNIYVADMAGGRILKFAPGGTLSASWNGGTSDGPPAASAQALSQDSTGKLYVADSLGDQVVILSSSGGVLRRLRGRGAFGPLRQPSGVAAGANGQVYVADTGNNRLVRFSRSGTIDAVWTQRGNYVGQFSAPHGLRVDSRGHVLVADSLNGRIEELNSNGSYHQIWYVQIKPSRSTSPSYPPSECSREYPCGRWTGLAVGPGGAIYATDSLHDLVVKLSPNGETIQKWGGSGSGEFRAPEGIAVSRAGTIYVADTGNHRIDILAPDGKFVGSIKRGLGKPDDVLVRERGHTKPTLFVADGANGQVSAYLLPR